MSDHFDSSRNASGDSVNPESGQFLSRRERRLSEAAQNAGPTLESTPVYQPPTIETPAGLVSSPAPARNPEPTVEPVSPVPEFVTPQVPVPEPQPEPVTSVVPVAEPEPVPAQLTTGPIPHIEKTPTGSIPAITAPDVATLTPIATPRATPIGRRLRNRVAESGRMRLRPDALKRRTLPKVGRALRWAAKEARSSTQRIFIVTLIGAFFLAFTLPSTGFNMDLPGFAATNNDDGQRVEAASGGDVATEISLDSFKVSSYGMVRGWSVASGYWAYKVNKTGPIRWPFLFAAPISSGFGSRSAPCRGCQSYHTGLDFNPDGGTDIHAVADGVVIEEENLHYSYGRFVVIHHNVNGMEFDSRYAHMIPSSVHLHVGDVVKVGDYVGEVGHTGNATGDHLHLEIIIDGTPVDPFPWLKKYAK